MSIVKILNLLIALYVVLNLPTSLSLKQISHSKLKRVAKDYLSLG